MGSWHWSFGHLLSGMSRKASPRKEKKTKQLLWCILLHRICDFSLFNNYRQKKVYILYKNMYKQGIVQARDASVRARENTAYFSQKKRERKAQHMWQSLDFSATIVGYHLSSPWEDASICHIMILHQFLGMHIESLLPWAPFLCMHEQACSDRW